MLLRAKCFRLLDWRPASSPCVSAGSAGRLARGELVVRRSLDRARRRLVVTSKLYTEEIKSHDPNWLKFGMRSSGLVELKMD
jgi:hypothetical protein